MKKSLLKNIIWFGISAVTCASLLPNLFSEYWFLDLFAHFKVQYLVIALILLTLSVLVFKTKALAISLLLTSILWNAYFIAPYYFNAKEDAPALGPTFKIASLNLLSSNSETDLVLQYIEQENPDILVLLELTPKWNLELSPVLQDYPFQQIHERIDNFGIAVVSKFEMTSKIIDFNANDKPSIVSELRINKKTYTLIATHPLPPIDQATFQSRNQQLQNIFKRKSEFADRFLVIGDFNTSSFSNHFRALVQDGIKDSRTGFGLLPTWPAGFGVFQTTLDHCLVSDQVQVVHRATGSSIGSDHLPISMVIGTD